MNTFVVSMLSDHGQPTALHASERALQGYCAFHHLLLAFCARRPDMRKEANRRVDQLLLTGRTTKREIPDMGVLLAVLAVTDRSWRDGQVAWAVLGETLDRNVRWLLPDYPYLRQGNKLNSANRMRLLADWHHGSRTSQ